MQDRYAGDIGDYGKIGLLRKIHSHGLSVGVNWYKTDPLESEKNKTGTFRQDDGKHLIPDNLRICDRELAERLSEIARPENRSIESLENANLIPNAVYYRDPITVSKRIEWHLRALEVLKNKDVVFLDPDNGMLVKSVGKRSAKSVKYVFYDEVTDYLEQKQSVIIYNHRCRKKEEQYFRDICEKFEKYSGIQEKDILKITFPKCSVRDYFAIPVNKDHRERLSSAFGSMTQGIWGERGVCRIPD